MPLLDCCQRNVVTVSPDAAIMEAIALMRDRNVGCVVVAQGKRPVGILTDRDIVLRAVLNGRDLKTTKVKDVMTRDPFCLQGSTGVYEALKQLKGKNFRRIPVTDGKGELLGIVTIDDFVRLLVKELSFISSIIEGQSPGF